ncbi:aldolase catalytic domain-containing protein [Paenibacillus alginolyticus]|uniref:Aldolase catalytic domain-containing protein n=1 Tax=Paenibacillus alginolyticus TaxID=59839 RepID=A0ABT4G7F1_9BACL|nr:MULTISPECIES: aldolase catalytic domain-containing protein [Paenibacillus]MCY9665332.1 aldolase catalytic domain-containing protein [Paenibacillus alginolyticus]MCY9692106.1 aldolase catalytic domain-containing protein [Paenibacillus alginolyticus]MEC0147872.1 aldolase catalytic domain-containing protein [Paenibacillus alginolyticus]NRF92132.1 nucleoid-structuring protein H-NS [Paenibacillus frigoriresistens]
MVKHHQHKILDCTIRDGGLVNDWDFSVEFVQDMYRGLSAAGVEYMEIGYKNSEKLLKGGASGPWRFLNESFLREVITKKTETKLSALVDIGRVDENDILPREDSLLDLIRVACYIKDVDKGLELVQKFNDMGYETSLNIMALSHVMENELVEAFEEINKSPVDVVYIVDSYGSMDHKDIDYLVTKFQRLLPEKELGLHMHNNLQLAFANTITGASKGVTFLDSSVYGMGRAAGNCTTELLLSYLKGARYDVRPVLEIIEKHMITMRQKWDWGYLIPYMIVGALDEHPRTAMALLSSDERNNFVDFYDRLTSVETAPIIHKK